MFGAGAGRAGAYERGAASSPRPTPLRIHRVRDLLLRLLRLHDATAAERRATVWTAAAFFWVLFAYYLLRPLRENVAYAFGNDHLVWLFSLTFVLTTLLNQPYLALVRRLPSQRFLPYALHAFAVSFLVFAALLAGGSGKLGALGLADWRGRGHAFFYSWVTAFSVCGVTLIWVHAVEWFTTAQGKRLFGLVSVGGTLGAMLGSLLSETLAARDYSTLCVLSAIAIEVAVLTWWRSLHWCRDMAGRHQGIVRGNAGPPFLPSLLHVLRAPYLRGMLLFVLLASVAATTFYYLRLGFVGEVVPDDQARRALEASINFWYNSICLCLQLVATSRALLLLGVGAVLCVMPFASGLGFTALTLWPTVGLFTGVEVLRRTLQFAFDKPAREVLYTPLTRDEKYVSKAIVDTAGLRFGDLVGATLNSVLAAFTRGHLLLLAAPLLALWGGTGLWLGRRCRRLERVQRASTS